MLKLQPTPGPGRTPFMFEYRVFKRRHPGVVLLFRNGDRYDIIRDDATLCGPLLGLHVEHDPDGVPVISVPAATVDNTTQILLEQGHGLGMCEPKPSEVATALRAAFGL